MSETEINCIDNEDKVKSVTDTDDKFTECQTPRKKLNIIMISDKWSRKNCSEHFNVSEYLVRTPQEMKKVGSILEKSAPNRDKLSSMKHFIL